MAPNYPPGHPNNSRHLEEQGYYQINCIVLRICSNVYMLLFCGAARAPLGDITRRALNQTNATSSVLGRRGLADPAAESLQDQKISRHQREDIYVSVGSTVVPASRRHLISIGELNLREPINDTVHLNPYIDVDRSAPIDPDRASVGIFDKLYKYSRAVEVGAQPDPQYLVKTRMMDTEWRAVLVNMVVRTLCQQMCMCSLLVCIAIGMYNTTF